MAVIKEREIPASWQPIDAPPVNPSQPAAIPPSTPPPSPVGNYFQGSISPNLQHDATFVGTEYRSPGIPSIALMPVSFSGNASLNSAVKSAAKTTPAPVSTTTTSSADLDLISINYQTGTKYTVQASDLDELISFSNNSGGTITLPVPIIGGSAFTPIAYVQSAIGNLPANAAANWTSNAPSMINTKGNTLLVFVNIPQGLNPSGGATTVSVSDTNLNNYTQVGLSYSDAAEQSWSVVFAASNIKAGANVVTVTSNKLINTGFISPSSGIVIVAEYLGNPSVPGIESSAGNQIVYPTTTSPNPVSLTTLYPNDIIALFYSGQHVVNPGVPPAGFIQHQGASGNNHYSDQAVFTPGTYVLDVAFPADIALNPPHGIGTVVYGVVLTNIAAAPSASFQKGWYCYIENTGTGIFNLTATAATIDGSSSPVAIGPNNGLLLVFDGKNWITERGMGGSGGGVGGTWNLTSQNSAYNAVAGDMVICDTSSAGFAVTIPLAASNAKKSIRIKKTSSDLNAVTPTASGSDLIDGQATQPFNGQETDMEITSDGVSNWWIA